MRKFLLLAIFAPFALIACNDDIKTTENENNENENTGSLVFGKMTLVIEEECFTRAITAEDLWLTLQNEDNEEDSIVMKYPASGEVKNIVPGKYHLELKSYQNSFSTPNFEDPIYVYYHPNQITIEAGKPTDCGSISVPQVNTGVKFDYSELEGTPLENIVPKVNYSYLGFDNSLTYDSENRHRTGYFYNDLPTWDMTITFTLNGNPVTVQGGEVSKKIAVDPGQLWNVALTIHEPENEVGYVGGNKLVIGF